MLTCVRVYEKIKKQMKRIRRLAVYFFSFGLARGALFVSPILLANLLPNRAYGTVEWAYTIASLGATIAALGTSSALPLVKLRKTLKGTMTGILAHHILVSLLCVALMCGVFLLDGSEVFSMAALFAAVIALQTLWSVLLKTNGKSEASLILDAGLFMFMVLTTAMASYLHAVDSLLWIFWIVTGYAFCLFFVAMLALFKLLRDGETIEYRGILTLGFPLMIAAIVSITIIALGRLVIGYFGGVLLAADYAILARVAALPMVAHQVVIVAKFRHLYTLPIKEMERVVILVLSVVALSVVGLWFVSSSFGWVIGPLFVKAFHNDHLPALWIMSQAILWSGISINDTINARQMTMSKVLPWCIAFLLISIPIAMILFQYVGVSLSHFVYIHGLLMLFFYLTQVAAMYRAGIRLIRAWALAVGSYVSLIALASLLYS